MRNESHIKIAMNAGSPSEALVALRQAEISPIRTMLAVHYAYGLALDEAKLALVRSPAWSAEAETAIRLHDQINNALDNDTI